MAVDNFIPHLWEGAGLTNLRKMHVFGAVANRDYEGTIRKAGDTVHIPMIAALSDAAYTKNSTSVSAADLYSADSVLVIDQARYVAFGVDDVDKAQTTGNVMNMGMEEAMYALNDTQDE